MDSYNILTGVGSLYIAPVGTAFPDCDDTPSSSWYDLGETRGGVKVTRSQKINTSRTDQRTGPVKAKRSEEDMSVETKLVEATLEKLAKFLGVSVTDTAAGSGTIGTRSIPLYRGSEVDEYAVLFRGNSPYGPWNAQYQLPRAYFDGDITEEHTKDGEGVEYGLTLKALEDLDAETVEERYGKLVAEDAAAT